MLVASMTYYFQLLDLGYGSGVVRHVTEADARHDIARVNRIMSTFVVVYAGLGLAAAAGVLGLIIWVVPRFPNLDADQIARAQTVLALMGIRIAVGFPMTVFGAATTARQRFALNNTVAVAVALLNGAATYAVLSAGYGLVALVAATTAISLTGYAGYAWTARRAFPELRLRWSAFTRGLVREVTTYSIYIFLVDVAIQIGFNLDNVVIGAALGTSAVGVYAIALRIADYQRQLCNQFNGLLFPVVVRHGAAGRTDALRSVLVDGTRIALTLAVGVTVCVIGFGRPLIHQWMGPGFEGSVFPLYVLALTGVVLVGQGPLGNILLGTGRHRLVAFTALAEALANLALSVVLVRRYGLAGVAIGTAAPVFIANLFVLMPAACRQLGVSVKEFGRLVTTAPLVGAVPAAMVAIALRLSWPPSSLAATLAEGAITALVYLTAVWLFGFTLTVRQRYFNEVRRLFPGSAPGSMRTAGA
jgi:O-antigen/teichoic acid export membrane protein